MRIRSNVAFECERGKNKAISNDLKEKHKRRVSINTDKQLLLQAEEKNDIIILTL